MGKNTKINISIIVISTITTFLQTLIISISSIYENIIFEIIVAILNAIIVALESLQLNIKRLKTRENSRRNSDEIEASPVNTDIEIKIEK